VSIVITNGAPCPYREILLNFYNRRETMGRTPNDDRSDSMNPNNDAYWDSLDNHSNQLNPNNDEYQGDDRNDSENE
jgi:hypothetical protein